MAYEVEALLQKLAVVDERTAVFCASQCARTVLHLVPVGEDRPSAALEAAEAWARADRGRGEGGAVEKLARDASRAGGPPTDPPGVYTHAGAARSAAHAAANVARAAARGRSSASRIVRAIRGTAHARACHAAVGLEGVALTTAWHGTHERHLEALLALVSTIRWPRTAPAPDQRNAAAPALQVAWDALRPDLRTDHVVPDLLSAHDRASRLGLDWTDPVQRAIAERTTDEDHIRQLLAGRMRCV